MSATVVPQGSIVPLARQLADGATGKFPQAKIYDLAGNLLTTVDLTHRAIGLYTNNAYVMPVKDSIFAVYVVYDDAPHTTPTVGVDQTTERFVAESFSAKSRIARLDRNADLTESQRGAHTWQGSYWYVAPVTGSDANPGTRLLPFKTLTAAVAAAGDATHDVISLLADQSGAITELVITATLVINKRYLFIRGPGGDFRIRRSNNGDVLNITADGVELSGFRVQTHTSGNGRGIHMDGVEFGRISRVWNDNARGHAIELENCDFCIVEECPILGAGDGGAGNGIHVSGNSASVRNRIERNRIYSPQNDGISLQGTGVDLTLIVENNIFGAGGYDLSVGSQATRTFYTDEFHSGEGSGYINDLGSGTINLSHLHSELGIQAAMTAQGYTTVRAPYLDELAAANLPTDVDALVARLTAARAGYLDELAAANLPADVDTLLGRLTAVRAALLDQITALRLAELDPANLPADVAAASAAIAALNDLSQAGVQTAMTAQGYTAAKAALDILTHKLLRNKFVLAADGTITITDDDGTTPLLTGTATDKDGNAITLAVGTPAQRTRLT